MDESKFTRREFHLGDSIQLEDNRRHWRVYNCPTNLISKYVSYAKLHFGNEVWKVLEKGMNLIMEEEGEWRISVEKRLKLIEDKLNKKENGYSTFGGGEE
jgi:hypothetical protein